MRYLKAFLFVLLFSYILLMPAWISWIPKTLWPLATKRVIVTIMVVVSTIFAVVVILKPITDRTTGIAANVLVILYLLIVFVTAYYNWPR